MPSGKRGGRLGGDAAADEPVRRFSQVIRTILSVMPGGVIRYGKAGPDDDAHVGFWLGVTAGRRREVLGRRAGVLAQVGRGAAAGAGQDLDAGRRCRGRPAALDRRGRRKTIGVPAGDGRVGALAGDGRPAAGRGRATRACSTCSSTATLRRVGAAAAADGARRRAGRYESTGTGRATREVFSDRRRGQRRCRGARSRWRVRETRQ